MNKSRLLRSMGIAIALVVGSSACGPDSTTTGVDMSAGGSAPTAGSQSGAAGAGNTSGGSSDAGGNTAGGRTAGGNTAAGGAPNPLHSGQMLLLNYLLQNHATMNSSFIAAQTGADSTCTTVSDAGCVVSTCDDAPAPTRSYASAGTLTVTSPQLTGSITQGPDASGQYSTVATSTLEHLFYGAETAVFKASGGVVPAFEEQLASPLILLLSTPLFGEGASFIEAPRTQDLSLTWTRGVPGVLFYITGSAGRADGMPGSTGMTCQFPSETGSALIKTSLLQQLGANTQLAVYTVVTKTITAGDYGVALAFVTLVGNPDKTLIPGLLVH